ncbi:conserved hypothetical protein [Ricinus communis]|uniref:Uncharacterized protein n=1 Tax=Ricinus communis TaxID=3988 RepID=B9RC05_RICCO|nr:conserved hypothetical protein [Ricinus communis]
MDGVISVIPNRILKLHTTRSWNFMGLSQGKLRASQEGNVIVVFSTQESGQNLKASMMTEGLLLLLNGRENAKVKATSPATTRLLELDGTTVRTGMTLLTLNPLEILMDMVRILLPPQQDERCKEQAALD